MGFWLSWQKLKDPESRTLEDEEKNVLRGFWIFIVPTILAQECAFLTIVGFLWNKYGWDRAMEAWRGLDGWLQATLILIWFATFAMSARLLLARVQQHYVVQQCKKTVKVSPKVDPKGVVKQLADALLFLLIWKLILLVTFVAVSVLTVAHVASGTEVAAQEYEVVKDSLVFLFLLQLDDNMGSWFGEKAVEISKIKALAIDVDQYGAYSTDTPLYNEMSAMPYSDNAPTYHHPDGASSPAMPYSAYAPTYNHAVAASAPVMYYVDAAATPANSAYY
jgi:hypothetical protein|uniref:Uncharacterized protein n=1 Tax=Eutreptiella gymnastica TaxID=73025 RepID=A0A6T2CSG5_9EUGL